MFGLQNSFNTHDIDIAGVMNMMQWATWMVQGPPELKGRVGTLNQKEFFNSVSVLHHGV